MLHPVSVQPLPDYRIHIKYSDGAQGDVDLSEFAGRGVFAAWADPQFFRLVHIGEHRQIQWNDEVELCPDAIYMRLTGKSPKEYFASRDAKPVNA
jgi:hypothetical protein